MVRSVHVLGLEGAGDAFLLEGSSGPRILIDAGERRTEVADRLVAAGVRHLDVAVCTHCDEDHIGGMQDVLDRVRVHELWVPGSWADVLVGAVCHDEDDVRRLLTAHLDTDTPAQALDDAFDPVDAWADAVVTQGEGEGPAVLDAHRLEQDPLEVIDAGIARFEVLDADDDEMDARLRKRLKALEPGNSR